MFSRKKNQQKTQVIKFIQDGKDFDFIELPKPATKHVPYWWIKMERYIGGEPKANEFGESNKTVKMCVPFRDALTIGYTVELWTDLHITRAAGYPQWTQTFKAPGVLGQRDPRSAEFVPIPMGCGTEHFIWQIPYAFQTPPGYSVFLTHPVNRHDLPFVTLSGVIDSDASVIGKGNYPFFLKEGFEGTIEAGTPIAQIIPFKRDNWVLEKAEDSMLKDSIKNAYLTNKSLRGGHYQKEMWSRKTYE